MPPGIGSAQRRPGPRPRRHSTGPASPRESWSPLNEGRGRDPGDTFEVHAGRQSRLLRSTKAGAETPATHAGCEPEQRRNEHAQRRPGPRPRRHASFTYRLPNPPGVAQRRPGPRPRRHRGVPGQLADVHHRSTKAGAETPATRQVGLAAVPRFFRAQRRPGPRPRRHMTAVRVPAVGCSAQRRPGPRPRRHNAVAPGATDSTVAQRRPGPRPRRHPPGIAGPRHRRRPLNEGRGRDPGDTEWPVGRLPVPLYAQRRPGPRPRRHD